MILKTFIEICNQLINYQTWITIIIKEKKSSEIKQNINNYWICKLESINIYSCKEL